MRTEIISEAVRQRNFWVGPHLTLAWHEPVREEISWEIFRGRLLDPAHTRQTKAFTAWSIYQLDGPARAAEPLLSVKLDEETGVIHVVRAILARVWVGVDAGTNVIESRETARWVRELVGTISPNTFANLTEVSAELTHLLRAAVEGTSRLPVTSVEAPLPAFSFGQLAYLPPGSESPPKEQPFASWQELIPALPQSLEPLLRAITPEQAPQAASLCADASCRTRLPTLLREMVNHVSLSPYTTFVETTITFVKALTARGIMASGDEIDLWSWLLRQLGRHLTAYDLITFHFRGANYPDALLLDAVLKRYVRLVEEQPRLFVGQGGQATEAQTRRRRRALRQASLLRRHYEGLPVPDAPTSPGENARVLPAPFVRVPEEQLSRVSLRRKRLYEGEPLPDLLTAPVRAVLAESMRDLTDAAEWRELGTAVFVDRPLGWAKEVGEPDLTPLLTHEAFSTSIARRRIAELEKLAEAVNLDGISWESIHGHENTPVAGLPASAVAAPPRPVLSLADARRVADDFVILRTLPRGLRDLVQALDMGRLRAFAAFPGAGDRIIVARVAGAGDGSVLAWFDGRYRKRLDMSVDVSHGFLCRGGVEMPVAGLRVARVWNEAGEEIAAGGAALIPRLGGS